MIWRAGRHTVPSTVAKEKQINPFMRVRGEAAQKYTKASDPVEVMRILRSKKDEFGLGSGRF